MTSVGASTPGPPDEPTVDAPRQIPLTDMGNAKRMHQEYGRVFRHNTALGWMHWDGQLWRPDDSEAGIGRAGQALQRLVLAEADRAHEAGLVERGHELLRYVRRAQSAATIANAIKLWRSWVFAPATAFDQHSRLVTMLNGTLALDDRDLGPLDAGLMCTRMMPVRYDPKAEAPFFTGTLEYFVPDRDVREYIQRLFGYCLTNDVGEQQFTVLVGAGANGKSTLLEAVRQVFGRGDERGFSREVNPKVFEARMAGSGGSPDPERFGLLGMKLVTPIETDSALKLDAPFIKAVTGGEAMTARDLFKTSVTWKPTFKIIFATNHEPRIDDDSEGMWRRVHKVPFDVRIPEEHRRPWEDTVTALRAERSGILNWMLDGYDEWCKHGLAAPPQVTLASAMMRADQDQLGVFLRECTEPEEGALTLRGDLWRAFGEWRRDDRELGRIGRTDFYTRMAKRLGEPDSRGHFRGIRVITWVPY